VVGLDVVVGVPIGAMPGRRQQLFQHACIHRRSVSDDLDWRALGRADGSFEEAAGCADVAPRGDEHVNHLPELINRTVDIAPLARDLHVGLIDLPAVPDGVSAGPGGLGEQRREPLQPAVDGDVVDLDAAFGQQFFDVGKDRPKRRYQRTASTITSGGKQKPAKADRETVVGRGQRVLMTSVCLLRARSQQMQQRPLVPQQEVEIGPQGLVEFRRRSDRDPLPPEPNRNMLPAS
jgi:hypothetical protein